MKIYNFLVGLSLSVGSAQGLAEKHPNCQDPFPFLAFERYAVGSANIDGPRNPAAPFAFQRDVYYANIRDQADRQHDAEVTLAIGLCNAIRSPEDGSIFDVAVTTGDVIFGSITGEAAEGCVAATEPDNSLIWRCAETVSRLIRCCTNDPVYEIIPSPIASATSTATPVASAEASPTQSPGSTTTPSLSPSPSPSPS